MVYGMAISRDGCFFSFIFSRKLCPFNPLFDFVESTIGMEFKRLKGWKGLWKGHGIGHLANIYRVNNYQKLKSIKSFWFVKEIVIRF